jgi:hypothetical protein
MEKKSGRVVKSVTSKKMGRSAKGPSTWTPSLLVLTQMSFFLMRTQLIKALYTLTLRAKKDLVARGQATVTKIHANI